MTRTWDDKDVIQGSEWHLTQSRQGITNNTEQYHGYIASPLHPEFNVWLCNKVLQTLTAHAEDSALFAGGREVSGSIVTTHWCWGEQRLQVWASEWNCRWWASWRCTLQLTHHTSVVCGWGLLPSTLSSRSSILLLTGRFGVLFGFLYSRFLWWILLWYTCTYLWRAWFEAAKMYHWPVSATWTCCSQYAVSEIVLAYLLWLSQG